jgi:ribonuclease III
MSGLDISPEELDTYIERAQKIVGHTFEDRSLLVAAITHPSALESGPVEKTYERLEFLGDSIVGAIVAARIYERFPRMDEGGMTRIKVSLVSGTMLSAVADQLGVADIIIFGGSETGTGKRGLGSALENVYEALTAALFLDAGIEEAQRWVSQTLGPQVAEQLAFEPENPKSSLQELLQVRHITPTYEVIDTQGPPHNRRFTAQALADGEVLGEGSGHSKKEAEAAAAEDALSRIPKR